jgi:N-acetylglutamate synthase-like GNAT family acetyltransferase
MKIRDLASKYKKLYCVCLEDWSDEMKEAGDHKAKWYDQMKDKGLRVKLAEDDNGVIGGMIQYIPIEHSFALGKDLYTILCIWVHGHKQGIGDYTNKGMGKTLLKAAEEDVKNLGGKGLVAWGLTIPAFMRASWFKKQGYEIVDKDGITALLWKPFSKEVQKPKLIHQIKKPEKIKGQVTVYAFKNGWCPASNLVYERAKRCSSSLGEKVVFIEFNTTDPKVFSEWGIMDGLFVNNKQIRTGPPPSYDTIYKIIQIQLRKL